MEAPSLSQNKQTPQPMTRISYDEGLTLYREGSLEDLKKRACEIRDQKNPKGQITFVLDSNPNYTNICKIGCSFCSFYKTKKAPGAFTLTVEEVMNHLQWAREKKLTAVLLQGGVHPDLGIDYFVSLVKTAQERYPEIHLHFFSAEEIQGCAAASHLTPKEVLSRLFTAGLRTLPGGGAEILSDRVRKKISPQKISSLDWIAIHEMAHEIGYRTTATMMYGHIEEPEDILTHLELIRKTQDRTKGFSAFIPWSYKRESNALGRKVAGWAGPEAYFRILAFSRIYLDNFDHIAASWFGEGKEAGIKALNYGADDFGGTVMAESVHKSAGWINECGEKEIIAMIRQAGFTPAQRDSFYNVIRRY